MSGDQCYINPSHVGSVQWWRSVLSINLSHVGSVGRLEIWPVMRWAVPVKTEVSNPRVG